MIFNFSKEYQFNTRLALNNNLLEQVKETRLLGVIISDNLKWHSNTKDIVTRCYQRMLILRNLYTFSIPIKDLVNIYCIYIRSVAEQSSVVWSSSITSGEEYDLERVQKVALRIILKEDYIDYRNALELSNLSTLKARRAKLSLNFALKCTTNERTREIFPLRDQNVNTRNPESYEVVRARTGRLANSAIPSMQRQLNSHAQRKL